MKRFLVILLCVTVSVLILSSCGNDNYDAILTEEDPVDILAEVGLSLEYDDAKNMVDRHTYFAEIFTFEEYCDLIAKLHTATGEQSLVVLYPINEEVFFVQKTVSTYNEDEAYFAIMNVNAELTVEWNSEWSYIYITDSVYNEFCVVPCGYSSYNGAVELCDVINMNGRRVATIEGNGDCFELGNGYILCAGPGVAGGATIVHTSGESHEVEGFGIGITGPNIVEEDAWIGKLSEGLWGTIVDRGNRGIYARYYNTNGEMVIDLRENLTNFAVTKLGEFTEGQAKIEFTGANHKNYYAYIDKTGAFVDEPIEITE